MKTNWFCRCRGRARIVIVTQQPQKRRNRSNDKTVFDVIDASSTASMKQRRMDHPKTNSHANIGTLSNNNEYQTKGNVTNDMDPPSIDWIEQMASTAKQMEQMAATTKHKFIEQRQYYESQLQAQREKNHEQGRENERLRMEKDAQNSSMKEEIEALKLELNKKGASLENLKESMRSLL